MEKQQHVLGRVHISVHSHTVTAIVLAMEYTMNLECSFVPVSTLALGVLMNKRLVAVVMQLARPELVDWLHSTVLAEHAFQRLHWTRRTLLDQTADVLIAPVTKADDRSPSCLSGQLQT